MKSTEFMSAAHRLGIDSDQSSLFLVAPDQLGICLLDAAKRLARFLKNIVPDLGHRKRLEVVAQGAGFPNWHAFQTLCQHVVEHNGRDAHGLINLVDVSVFEPFIPALPLLITIRTDTAPDPDQVFGLEALGRRLAVALTQPTSSVLDILAKLYGADTWRLLCERKPEDSTAPLYVFSVYQGSGVFRWSPACAALVEEMDDLWQGYDGRSKTDQSKARRHIKAIVKKRPDFLEGCLALAEITDLGGAPQDAGPILDQAIKRADLLIPAKFKGEISWYDMDNRFYHRLLFARMRWCATHGLMQDAIDLAQRQLRLNKDDNLGVRISLPALLAAKGDHNAAKIELRRISHPDVGQDGHILLVRSLCHLAAGDFEEGKMLFLRALFEFPAIRPLILEREVPDIRGASGTWHRGVIPDVKMLWFDYCNVYERYPTQTEDVFVRLLLHPAVISAEKELAAAYATGRADLMKPGGNRGLPMAKWEDRVLEASQSLAISIT